MPKLSQIQKADEIKSVTVDFGDGESLNLMVYPNRITGKRRRQLQEIDETDDSEAYVDLFFGIIQKWDLTDDKGKVLPFDAETIDLLSIPTTIRIFNEIGEAANPNPRTARGSRRR